MNGCDVERDVPVNVDEIVDYFWNMIGINGGRVISIPIVNKRFLTIKWLHDGSRKMVSHISWQKEEHGIARFTNA